MKSLSKSVYTSLRIRNGVAIFCLPLMFASSVMNVAWADGLDAIAEHKEKGDVPPVEVKAQTVPQPAENINLKDVVDEPLVSKEVPKQIQAVDQPASEKQAQPSNVAPSIKSNASSASALVDVSTEEANIDGEIENTRPMITAVPKQGILKKITQGLIGSEVPTVEPLVLLGSEVLPGTSARLGWSPGASFIGIAAPTAVLVLNGVKSGPKLCLTGAVHGDELNGIEIVRRLMYDIDPKKLQGTVIGVPIVNLQGFRRGSRYLPDRRDLNRFFPGNPDGSSAARIAHSFFSEIVSHCDLLIDLHTGSFRRTNLPQLRADLTKAEVDNLAKKMGAIVVVQSEGAEGSLRRAAVENGIPAVTLEAGAPHELSRADIEHGVKSIESAMDNLGMIHRRRFWERAAEPVYYESTWIRAKDGGMLFSEVALGNEVLQGDLLGVVTDPITNKSSEIRAPFDGQIIGMALNQVMFPGFAAYHIGHKAPDNMLINANDKTANSDAGVDVYSVTAQPESPAAVIEGGVYKETAKEAASDVVEEPIDLVPIEDSE